MTPTPPANAGGWDSHKGDGVFLKGTTMNMIDNAQKFGPVFHAVADKRGDYLAAVAELERSHADLLAAMMDAAHDLEYLAGQPWKVRSEGDRVVAGNRARQLRAAIAKAEGR